MRKESIEPLLRRQLLRGSQYGFFLSQGEL
jgi:hypothetical protein